MIPSPHSPPVQLRHGALIGDSMIAHKITVNKRIIESDFANRHDKYRKQRRARIADCIACIRQLQNNPTEADKYNNPAKHFN